ncbi:MFS transporter [Bradyrhizobium sp. AUGA SZCCT0160]|uniref:MFS transporter n=1 Tax=Bradyrhizobium sp. AUGA SZCCT0160 TaxID=2807662 RepID=UPI001BACE5AF|nr:MFS transporter [Bradyrhizobium sp. AUGA SZCCT0160]MBR1192105.1 MFS transporter [Bradyrhizobium sp. AUGA SZCCT0160]
MRISRPIAYIVLYVTLYAAFGVASPFWPKFFETRALTPQQIGLILGAAILVRLAAGPLVGILADLLGSLRLLLATCAALAAATAAAFLLANTFWLLFLIALVQAAALTPTTSIADALSVNAAKPEIAGKPFEYGWIRGSGSAAFVLGTLVIGQLVSHHDLTPIIWMNVALLAAAAGATALLPRVTIQPAPHDGPPVLADLRGLLKIPRFRFLVLVSALVYGSHAMHDAFAVIRWSAAGIDTSIISVLWSDAVAAEVIVFFLVGPALLDRFGARGAAALAAAAGIIRWSIEGVSTSVLVLSILQPLHGLTFALLHLACMRMMASLVPSGTAGTAQALYAFGSALATAALILLSGILYARFGATAFFPMALLCGVALPCAWFGFSDIRDRSTDAA